MKKKNCIYLIIIQIVSFFLLTSTYPLEKSFFDNYRKNGEKIHIKTVDNIKKSAVKESETFSHIYEEIKEIRPNFITEIAVYVETEKRLETIQALKENLINFDKYAEIPYISRQYKKTYPLFTNIKKTEISTTPETGNWLLDCNMRPFGNYQTEIIMYSNEDCVSLTFSNTTPIFYDNFKAITVGDMLWIIEAKVVDNGVLIYCVGAIKAFDLFGILHDRLENSLEGRIEAFFNWNYNSLF